MIFTLSFQLPLYFLQKDNMDSLFRIEMMFMWGFPFAQYLNDCDGTCPGLWLWSYHFVIISQRVPMLNMGNGYRSYQGPFPESWWNSHWHPMHRFLWGLHTLPTFLPYYSVKFQIIVNWRKETPRRFFISFSLIAWARSTWLYTFYFIFFWALLLHSVTLL